MRTRDDAERLARLLDGTAPEGAASDDARRLATLARRIEERAAPLHAPNAEGIRRRVLVRLAERPPTLGARVRATAGHTAASVGYSVRAATASAFAIAVLLVGGIAVGTQLSLPGDAFHPLKVGMEQVQLDRATTAAERAEILLAIAETRIGEAERAVELERPFAAEEALQRADAAVREAAELALNRFLETREDSAYESLVTFVDVQRPRLEALAPRLLGETRHVLAGLQTTFDRIAARLDALLGQGCCPDAFTTAPGLPRPGVGFDFGRIPPVDEPFEPCPCPPEPTPPATAAEDDQPASDPDDEPAEEPEEPREPVDPIPPTEPPADDPDGGLVEDTTDGVRDTLDAVNKVIEDLLDAADDLLPGLGD